MRYPLDELLDKRSIIQLKMERLEGDELESLIREFNDYTKAIEEYISEGVCTYPQFDQWHKELYEANGRTWDLEANLRKGQIGKMSLEDVGRTAIAIRESNGFRVSIKSKIVSETGVGYRDIKINHASQKTYK